MTYSAVTCWEELDSYSESWGLESREPSVSLRCVWGNRYALVADLLGNRRPWPNGTFATQPRATSCTISGFGSPVALGQQLVYEHAIVAVNYSTRTEEDLVSEEIEPSVEFQQLDHKSFRWAAADGKPLLEGEAPGKQLHQLTIVRTLYNVPRPYPIALLNLQGKVNEEEYESPLLGFTFAKETLLYQPAKLSRTITTNGVKGANITLRLQYKPDGWNKFWQAESNAYEEMYRVSEPAEPYKNYPLADMSDFLF